MTEHERIFDAFRNCITDGKCKECPWTECKKLNNKRVDIPIDLCLAVLRIIELPAEITYNFDGDLICSACGGDVDVKHGVCLKCGRKVSYAK